MNINLVRAEIAELEEKLSSATAEESASIIDRLGALRSVLDDAANDSVDFVDE